MPDADPAIAARDVPAALFLTAALAFLGLPLWRRGRRDGRLSRPAGWALLVLYAGYLARLLLDGRLPVG